MYLFKGNFSSIVIHQKWFLFIFFYPLKIFLNHFIVQWILKFLGSISPAFLTDPFMCFYFSKKQKTKKKTSVPPARLCLLALSVWQTSRSTGSRYLQGSGAHTCTHTFWLKRSICKRSLRYCLYFLTFSEFPFCVKWLIWAASLSKTN